MTYVLIAVGVICALMLFAWLGFFRTIAIGAICWAVIHFGNLSVNDFTPTAYNMSAGHAPTVSPATAPPPVAFQPQQGSAQLTPITQVDVKQKQSLSQQLNQLGTIMLAFLLLPSVAWLGLLLGIVLLGWTIFLFDGGKWGRSITATFIGIAGILVFFAGPISAALPSITIWWVLGFGAAWIVAALLTVVAYLAFYSWRARSKYEAFLDALDDGEVIKSIRLAVDPNAERYYRLLNDSRRNEREEIEFQSLKASVETIQPSADAITMRRKMMIIGDSSKLRKIYQDYDNDLTFPELNTKYAEDKPLMAYQAELDKVLPLRYKIMRQFLLWAGINWPGTVLWLLLHRVLHVIIERFLGRFKKFLDWFSSYTFGAA